MTTKELAVLESIEAITGPINKMARDATVKLQQIEIFLVDAEIGIGTRLTLNSGACLAFEKRGSSWQLEIDGKRAIEAKKVVKIEAADAVLALLSQIKEVAGKLQQFDRSNQEKST